MYTCYECGNDFEEGKVKIEINDHPTCEDCAGVVLERGGFNE